MEVEENNELMLNGRNNLGQFVSGRKETELCMGGSCPYTCCKGWSILIDDKTYANYLKEKGLLGLAVKYCSRGQKFTGHCKFHTREGLCYFQKNNRLDLMPRVCRLFPRRVMDYGDYGEMTYYLSCYNVARDFVEDPDSFRLVEADEEAEANWPMGNHDPAFLDFLLRNRQQIIDYNPQPESWRERILEIYRRTYGQNQYIARQNFVDFDEIKADPPPPITPDKGCLFYPVHFLNYLLLNYVARSRSCIRGTFLYGVIERYSRLTGKLTEREADSFIEQLIREMNVSDSSMEAFAHRYFEYMILQDYCLAYEDYYILEPVLTSIVSTELFIMLCATEYHQGRELTTDYKAALLSQLEKASRSSAEFSNMIIEQTRKYFG